MQQVIEQKILSRIYGNGRGWAFSRADFADLGARPGARPTIDSALHRREHESVVRRVIRGIYDYPRYSKALRGPVSPDIDQVAHALARKFRRRGALFCSAVAVGRFSGVDRARAGKPSISTRYDAGRGIVWFSSLFKWDQELYTDKLVRRATLDLAFTPGRTRDGKVGGRRGS
jgi:hypothetical protein